MPANRKVARCVRKVRKKGHSKVSSIKICQKSTGMSYHKKRKR